MNRTTSIIVTKACKQLLMIRRISTICLTQTFACQGHLNRLSWVNKYSEALPTLLGGVHYRLVSSSQASCSSDKSKDGQSQEDDIDLDLDEIKSLDKDLVKNDPELKALLHDIKRDFEGGKVQDNNIIRDKKEGPRPPNETQDLSRINFNLNNSTSETDLASDPDKIDADFEYDYRVADDIEEYDYLEESELAKQQVRPEKVLPISLERGSSGVFDLEELLILLEDLGAENVVSVPVPPEANYCDHMVVVSAKSKRHMQAINDELLWVHKRKKSKQDPHLVIEGKGKSDWCAMDLGNIVLHIFYGESREYYDIESLWILGPDKDPNCQDAGHDPYALSPEDLFWLETEKVASKGTDKTVPAEDGINDSEREGGRVETTAKYSSTKKPPSWPNGVKEEDAGWGSPKPTPAK